MLEKTEVRSDFFLSFHIDSLELRENLYHIFMVPTWNLVYKDILTQLQILFKGWKET